MLLVLSLSLSHFMYKSLEFHCISPENTQICAFNTFVHTTFTHYFFLYRKNYGSNLNLHLSLQMTVVVIHTSCFISFYRLFHSCLVKNRKKNVR